MSTIQATNLKNALSTTNNAVMSASGDLTNAAGISYMGGSKNLLINGAMQVAQRSSSSAGITTIGYYTADRWGIQTAGSAAGTWTQSIENDAPTGSGLRKSLKMLVTTAKASLAAGDHVALGQTLEGQDVQRIAKGTASAQQVTASFWVKSNVTGTYTAYLFDTDNTRSVSASYTIIASATWEKKTITFPADTAGNPFDNDNAGSLSLAFNLVAGTTYTSGTLGTSWAAYSASALAVGQTNLAASTNNYWQITGTQLEIGPVATSFEFEDYATTLRKCQRYYEKSYDLSVIPGSISSVGVEILFLTNLAAGTHQTYAPVRFKVPKRSAPNSYSVYSPATGASGKARDFVSGTDVNAVFAALYENVAWIDVTGSSSTTINLQFQWYVSSEL